MYKLDKTITKIEFYRRISYLFLGLMLFNLVPVGLAMTAKKISLISFKVSIIVGVIFIVSLILFCIINLARDSEIADLKGKYKQLKIKDNSYCNELLFIAPNTIFLQGPDCGDTVIIIAILNIDYIINPVVKGRKVIKEEAEKIFDF